jgi:hypothetical protein
MIKIINKNIFNGAILGFIAAILISLFSSINTINYTSGFYTDLKTMYEKNLIGQNYIQISRVYLLYCDRELNHFLMAGDTAGRYSAIINIKKFKQSFVENIKITEPTYNSPEGKNHMAGMKEAQLEYFTLLEKIIGEYKKGGATPDFRAFGELISKFDRLDKLLDRLDDIKQENDLLVYKKIINEHETALLISVLVLVGSIIFRVILLIRNHNKGNNCDAV